MLGRNASGRLQNVSEAVRLFHRDWESRDVVAHMCNDVAHANLSLPLCYVLKIQMDYKVIE